MFHQSNPHASPQSFHGCNAGGLPMADSIFFNPETAQEICPGIWLGPYTSLNNGGSRAAPEPSFIARNKVKMIINCGSTLKFLDKVAHDPHVTISSEVIILSLDPAVHHQRERIGEFTDKFNRILQNYLSSFYTNNANAAKLVHRLPQSHTLNTITSPLFSGSNLKIQFFKVVRLISLFRTIFNQDLQILIVSETGNLNLSTGLCVAYLMDHYKYNLANCFRLLRSKRPTVGELKSNYYDDLLIIESLKKFYSENCEIKDQNPGLLVSHFKRGKCDDDDDGDGDGDSMMDEIMVGGDRKRKLR
ncbi:uncharacterized protein LODBEIA_P06090 [Lodderomyces beijingensis]|uniref:Protein-tyrosine-phosphatase n=1 Tax=Lodderomyces beijingensis TaxID=1775926 RepID=A0ABP0ZDY5_9ASCO